MSRDAELTGSLTPRAEARSPAAYVGDAATILQTIHDLIFAAKSSIVLQMYMFAGNGETEMLQRREGAFPYARLVADWLIERRDELDIVVVLDTQTIDRVELTRNRSGVLTRERLAAAGITVLHANLFGTRFDSARRFPPGARLHDGRYRATGAASYGRAQQRWQTWHNVEDHRKNVVIDEGSWAAVTSHNFIDVASRWHENLFLVGAPAAGAIWDQARHAITRALELPQRASPAQRERATALAARSAATAATPILRIAPGPDLAPLSLDPTATRAPPAETSCAVEVLQTLEIRPRLVEALAAARPGDEIRAASAWFSDLPLLETFIAAARRGVRVRLLVDDLAALAVDRVSSWAIRALANFRVTERAREVVLSTFELRVHPSANERMMHLKTCAFLGARRLLIGGQANYTPNSFNGAWHETDVVIEGSAVVDAYLAQFSELWARSHPPSALAIHDRLLRRACLWGVEKTVFTF